jgi:hypothetical protein
MDGQQAATQMEWTARIFMLWMSLDSPRNVLFNTGKRLWPMALAFIRTNFFYPQKKKLFFTL